MLGPYKEGFRGKGDGGRILEIVHKNIYKQKVLKVFNKKIFDIVFLF